MLAELSALAVPVQVAADQRSNLVKAEDGSSLIRQELIRLAAGDLVGAEALDLATDPLSRDSEAFESKYQLAACP